MWSHVFFAAPHRVFFAGGLGQALLALLFWGIELTGRQAGWMLPWPVPATWLHAGMMLYGIFPWFILGFLMTALPKWMAHPPLKRSEYLPSFLLMAVGTVACWLGLGWPGLLMPATLAVALGLLLAVAVLLRVTFRGQGGRVHALLVLATLALGALGLGLHGLALGRMEAALQGVAVILGIWCFLLPLFYIVLHRMLPFFTAAVLPGFEAWRPHGVLYLMLLCLAGHGVLQLLGLPTWPVDLGAAGLAWYCLVRWGFLQALRVPMLAMLHGGWLWACLGLSLYALQSLLAAAGVAWGGLAPLHVLGLGCFASILLGMGTRVTRGHSGRPIVGDRWGWRCFLILQPAVLLRLLGEFQPLGGNVNLLAVLVAGAAFLVWGLVHGPMYFRPRPDGMEG
ncbi:NnrS family protein [Azovibrio restrictus]|uniref:NnrS family protein n=1 Tax=Azovibrio restrictus TaxID=146938 RepID=UPI0026EEA7FB|nr:NnrS family protein [Azovibrio restrictus]